MNESNLYLIGDIPGFTPQIGRLVSMMNYVRSTTLSAVAGLEMDELDYIHDPQSNSIGALLLHIAAAEVGYQAHTFYARDLSKEERDGCYVTEASSIRRAVYTQTVFNTDLPL